MIRRLLLPFLALTFWVSPVWSQGLFWVTETTAGSKPPQKAEFYAMPKRMKIVTADGPTMILRSDEDKLISVNPKDKTYWELPFSRLEAMSKDMQKEMDAAMAQVRDKLKDLPPEQRLAIEKALGNAKGAEGTAPLPVEVQNTGETKKIAGYTCTKYVASEGGSPILVAWTAKDVPGFSALREDWLLLQKRMNETNRAFRSGMAEAYTKIDGFPMETEIGQVKTQVTKVEPRDIPAAEFEPPAGYKKQPPPLPDVGSKP